MLAFQSMEETAELDAPHPPSDAEAPTDHHKYFQIESESKEEIKSG